MKEFKEFEELQEFKGEEPEARIQEDGACWRNGEWAI
jgi:hypothetical protein